MKIVIDVRCLMEGRRTGVEEYTLELLENIFLQDSKNEFVLFLNSWKEPVFDFSVFSQFKNISIKRLKIPNKILNFLFWYFNWPKIDRITGNADAVFLPNIIFSAVSKKAKLITTIHDLSFERYPEFFSLKRKWWHIFINPKKLCRRAEKIIAVSESTKNDLISLYNIPERKIETIHSAISDKFKIADRNDSKLLEVKEKYSLPYKFILHLGTIEPRKNIQSIISAYGALQEYAVKDKIEEIVKYKLVIAGGKGWEFEEIFSSVKNYSFSENIILTGPISEEDKVYLYNLASVFVYPSFFEGFGFPPLEAMACGVPVITSNNSSLPEVAGIAAIMIDSDKPDEIFQAMKEIISDKELREKIIKKGLDKSKEFSWQKTAEITLAVLGNK